MKTHLPIAAGRPLWRLRARLVGALAAVLGLLATPAGAQTPAATAPACPPAAAMPTPEQLQAAQREARDHGLLWRIRKGDHESYLYGTIHVGKLEWAMPGPNLVAALRGTDTLALELDVMDPAITLALVKPEAPEKRLLLPPALAERLARQREAACVPPGAFDAMHPVMQAVSLVAFAARWEGLDPAYAQEIVLGSAARSLQRGVVSLETPQLQLSAMVPGQPEEAVKLLDDTLRQLEDNRARPVIRRLSQAWADSRLDDLENYAQWCDCMHSDADRQAYKRLLDDRNPNLAARIDEVHASGKRVLAAVGALHMVGPSGLPALLAARGYQVTQITPTPAVR
jgi:uncharacterized protein YbaP (TraB family)